MNPNLLKMYQYSFLFLIFVNTLVNGQRNIPWRNSANSLSMFEDQGYLQKGTNYTDGKYPKGMNIFRLNNTVVPILYDLKMVPQLDGNFSFSGMVDIALKVNKPTKSFFLHSHELDIISVDTFRNIRKIESNFILLPENQMLQVTTKQKLFRSNTVTVSIKFSGKLNDEMNGFYRSSYDLKNSTKWLATTKFEPTFARWAFPCFDEPKFRAKFIITVARFSYQKSISNMPLKSTSLPDPKINNRVWDSFEVTPPMPTYLVAFMVNEFGNRTDAEGKVRVWTRENALQDAAYAQTQGAALLKHMEKYIGIPFTLPKIDIVAIPDFQAGAMENWGLTTYREKYVLMNESVCDERSKDAITAVIAHEFSHQWFGDLVTPAWWDSLWLNEGFAAYFEYYLTAMREPSWRMGELFVVEVLHDALSQDGIHVHRAMTSPVSSPSEIRSLFDIISYDKAASVIRMIEHVLSPTTFQKALQLYLNSRKDAGGVADTANLYDALEVQMHKERRSLPSNLTITRVFKKFSEQIGYPCLTISRHRNGVNNDISIHQKSYKSPRSTKTVTEKHWYVPLSCTTKTESNFTNTAPSIWLVGSQKLILPNAVKDEEWIICNLQQTGYYRVNYDPENWRLIINQLHASYSKIHPLNRAQLIDDSYTFAIDDQLPIPVFLDLLRYLEHDTDPIPWKRGLIICYKLTRQYEATKASTELQQFAKHIIGHFYHFMGFYEKSSDCHSMKTLRSYLTFVASELEMEDAVNKANAEFSSKKDLSEIPAYVKETVLCTAIRMTPEISVWNKLWDLYRKSNVQFEKITVLLSLGCANNETLLKKYLFKLVDDNDHDIRTQDQRFVIASMNRFHRGVLASINFIHDIIPKLGNYTKAQNVVIRLLWDINGKVQSHLQIHRLDHVIEEAEKLNQQKYGDIKEALNNVKVNAVKLIARNEEVAGKILAALKPKEPTPPPPPPPHNHTHPPKPSAASYIFPHMLPLMIIFLVTINYVGLSERNFTN